MSKRLLLQVNRQNYSVEVDFGLKMKLDVSVYSRMQDKQFYVDVENALHKRIGEKIKASTHEIIDSELRQLEFNRGSYDSN